MSKDDWLELVEQVKDHGSGAVVFYLDDDYTPTQPLRVTDVYFEDNEVRVVIGT